MFSRLISLMLLGIHLKFSHNNIPLQQFPGLSRLGQRSHLGRQSKYTMADPFEVRMRFSSQLQHLNASVTSAQKAASYALKYKDMDEDLHSCILEQLERVCVLGSIVHHFENGSAENSTEQHEHPRQHNVLHRALPGDGTEGRSRRLCTNDTARHNTSRRCRRSG